MAKFVVVACWVVRLPAVSMVVVPVCPAAKKLALNREANNAVDVA